MPSPLVSVYIPAHNYGRFLNGAIRSVLAQTLTDWELIVIDDGSTDDTGQVLEQHRDTPNVRFYSQPQQGLNATCHRAVDLSRGRYVLRLDADDVLEPTILADLAEWLERDPSAVLAYPDFHVIGTNGDEASHHAVVAPPPLVDLPPHGACTMIRRQALLDAGNYWKDFTCQDGYDVWLKLSRLGRTVHVPKKLFRYNNHGGNLSRDIDRLRSARAAMNQRMIDESGLRRPTVDAVVVAPGNGGISTTAVEQTVATARESQHVLEVTVLTDSADVERSLGSTVRVVAAPASNWETPTALRQAYARDDHAADALCFLGVGLLPDRHVLIDRAVDAMTVFDTEIVLSTHREMGDTDRPAALSPLALNGAMRLMRTRSNGATQESATAIGHVELTRDEADHVAPAL